MSGASGPSRLDRRKARTRGALIAAAREMLASRDPAEVSIQDITEAADVGFGSFYNHANPAASAPLPADSARPATVAGRSAEEPRSRWPSHRRGCKCAGLIDGPFICAAQEWS